MDHYIKKISFVITVALILTAVTGLSSCEKYNFVPPAVDSNAVWHLSTDIQPIFNTNCVGCHGGVRSPDLREGRSFISLTGGHYVDLPARTSRLYSKITSGDHVPRTSDVEKLKILYWITQGAQNN
jgi:hypothetical protein